MSTTVADIKLVAKELASESDDRINLFIEVAATMLNQSKFGTKYDRAQCFLACHLITLANREGVSGAVVSQSSGDVSYSYQAPTSVEMLAQTSYGMLFKQVRDTLSRGPVVI